jgi:putative CocE/NonD family hydrolase
MTTAATPAATDDGVMLGGVRVERDVPVAMRDGVTLRADVYRPCDADDRRLPVLLVRTPYSKANALTVTYQHPAWYARRGYVVVSQDVRGRFGSDGAFDPFHHEAADGHDTVAWASRLPGTTGQVGMYGFSYGGATQMLAATERPEGLACLVPGFTASDYYDGWMYEGGAFNHAFIVSWIIQSLAGPEAARAGQAEVAERLYRQANHDFPRLHAELPLRDFPPLRGTDLAGYLRDWMDHPTRDAYWAEIGLRHRWDSIVQPALHLAGWYDQFREGTLENFQQLRARSGGAPERLQKLVVGPWVHIPWGRHAGADFGPAADNRIDELQLRWFDHWLRGVDTGLADEAPVQLFVMGANRWREADDWPPPEARTETWHLRSDGRANSLSGDGTLTREAPAADEPPDLFVYLPAAAVPSVGGNSCCRADAAPMGAFDQALVEARNDVLVYDGPVLERAVEVIGTVELVLHAATDAVDTDWTAKLVDVAPCGATVNLCDGIVRAAFRDSLSDPQPVEPGRVYEYRIRVGSTANRFEAGHRIRLEVSSSNFPAYDPNLNTGERVFDRGVTAGRPATQAVFHDGLRPSRLLLPVVPR